MTRVVILARSVRRARHRARLWAKAAIPGVQVAALALDAWRVFEFDECTVYPFDTDFGRWLDDRPVGGAALALVGAALVGGDLPIPGAILDSWVWSVRALDPDVIDVAEFPGGRDGYERLGVSSRVGVAAAPAPVAPIDRRSAERSLVSVVLPVYNGGSWLERSVRSCLEQTHRRLEVIAIDDCSTDDTPRTLERIAAEDGRLRVYRNERNLRLPGALNAGFARTEGALLTWTSHDNYFAPDAIATLADYLATWEDIDFVYSAYREVDERDREDPAILHRPPPWMLRRRNIVGACFLYRRAIYENTGEFRRDLEYVEDYEYWVRVARRYRLMRLPYPLYYYRRHEQPMTAKANNEARYAPLIARVHAEHYPVS